MMAHRALVMLTSIMSRMKSLILICRLKTRVKMKSLMICSQKNRFLQNLSLQVHPLTEYIRSRFGMAYTQDESYYVLDVGEGGGVFLGLKERVDRDAFERDLRLAQEGGPSFPAEKYVNLFPANKHDHFLPPL